MFAQHPLQSEDTIQHVKIIKGMYSDTLLNVISWLCRTLFSETHQLFMASQETFALITYCVLDHFYFTSHRARFGEEQETLCKLFKPIKGVITDLWYSRYVHDWPTKVHHARRDTFGIKTRFSLLPTQGINRNTFINDVEKELQRRISDNTSLLDVDVIYI